MKEITADYWIVEGRRVKLQIKTNMEQAELQEILQDWACTSYGFIPKTMQDIYIFEKEFSKQKDLTRFINSDMINKQIKKREVSENG